MIGRCFSRSRPLIQAARFPARPREFRPRNTGIPLRYFAAHASFAQQIQIESAKTELKKIEKQIQKNPNDPILYFNKVWPNNQLGLISFLGSETIRNL